MKGVNWFKRKRRWQVRITVNRTTHHLGYFATHKRACEVRKAAEDHYGVFVGVSYSKTCGRFRAVIRGRHIGYFKTHAEAAQAVEQFCPATFN